MVLTILEATVAESHWQTLQDTYARMVKSLPPEITATYLVQSQHEHTIWRILTVWESQQALDAMRATGQTPTGVVIFQAAGARPELTVFDVQQAA